MHDCQCTVCSELSSSLLCLVFLRQCRVSRYIYFYIIHIYCYVFELFRVFYLLIVASLLSLCIENFILDKSNVQMFELKFFFFFYKCFELL